MLLGPSKQLKQNIFKNPNWPEASEPVGYLQAWPIEDLDSRLPRNKPGTDSGQSGTRTRGTVGLRVRHADHSATLHFSAESQLRHLSKSRAFGFCCCCLRGGEGGRGGGGVEHC